MTISANPRLQKLHIAIIYGQEDLCNSLILSSLHDSTILTINKLHIAATELRLDFNTKNPGSPFKSTPSQEQMYNKANRYQ